MFLFALVMRADETPTMPDFSDMINNLFQPPWHPDRNLNIGQQCSPAEVEQGCYEFYDENNAATWTYAPSVIVWRT